MIEYIIQGFFIGLGATLFFIISPYIIAGGLWFWKEILKPEKKQTVYRQPKMTYEEVIRREKQKLHQNQEYIENSSDSKEDDY